MGKDENPFDTLNLLRSLLDCMPEPILVADMTNTIVYMNRSAESEFSKGRALLGCSLFDCHKQPSNDKILQQVAEMKAGADELLVSERPGRRTTVRAIRNVSGDMIGYYERYESIPLGES